MSQAVAIVTDDPGWHGKVLHAAFAERGYEGRYLSLTQCRIEIADGGVSVQLPGFESEAPVGVFVRGVPGGTLEEVVFHLNVLHTLEALGYTVYNGGRAIERSVDKAYTTAALQLAGVPTPPTWVLRDAGQARALVERELGAGQRLVYKPLFGSQGAGLLRIEDPAQLAELHGGVYYLQRYLDCGVNNFHDWRVFVIGGRAVAAMRRWGQSWLNNVAQGGRCEAVQLDLPLKRLAEQAVAALDMAYGGVDIMCPAEGGFTVIEVNSVPAWKGLQGVCAESIAGLLVEDFLCRCDARASQRIAV